MVIAVTAGNGKNMDCKAAQGYYFGRPVSPLEQGSVKK